MITSTRPSRSHRRIIAGTAILVAGCFSLFTVGTAHATVTLKEASIDGTGNGFIRTEFVEVGARPNGTFGSNSAVPDGTWHPNDTEHPNKIGFRADREKNGWGGGVDDGDFFLPGTPMEAFALEVDGSLARSIHEAPRAPAVEVTGSFTSKSTSGDPSLTWNSSSDFHGVALSQTYSVPSNGSLALNISVTVTNHNASPSEVYYMRAVDPDNCRTRTTTVCDTNGDHVADATGMSGFNGYNTWNKILSQRLDSGASSTVIASQTDGSMLQLTTLDSESVVLTGAQGWNCAVPLPLSGAYQAPRTATSASSWLGSNTCPWANKVGEEYFFDDSIALIVHRTLPAGASSTFMVRYLLSDAEDPNAAPFVTPLPATGANTTPLVVLGALLLVGGVSILGVRRRRPAAR